MNYKKLEKSLETISRELSGIEERREKIISESRNVTSSSAKAILNIHLRKLREARRHLSAAASLLEDLRKIRGRELGRYLIPPETEFVEASVLYSIVTRRSIPSQSELGVEGVSYILGILDTIGELKRLTYDEIREARSLDAARLFKLMERLYTVLSPFSAYNHVAPGVKRKLDVARILVEDVRSTVTEEKRRVELMKALEELSSRMPKTHPS